jgi:DNA-binding NarL/FixJ family response regulator
VKNPSNPLIYIIDHNPVYRNIVKNFLEALDYKNIRSYSNCEEMQKANLSPDIIILDQELGKNQMKGLDFFIKFKTTYRDTHFIFLSSNTNIEIAVSSIKLGAFDYIIKSRIGLERLITRISGLISNQKKSKARTKTYNTAIVSLGMFSLIFVLAIILYNY